MDCQGLASEVPIAMIRQRTRVDFNEVILDCYFGQMNKRSDERHQIKEPYIHQFKVVYIHRQRKEALVISTEQKFLL